MAHNNTARHTVCTSLTRHCALLFAASAALIAVAAASVAPTVRDHTTVNAFTVGSAGLSPSGSLAVTDDLTWVLDDGQFKRTLRLKGRTQWSVYLEGAGSEWELDLHVNKLLRDEQSFRGVVSATRGAITGRNVGAVSYRKPNGRRGELHETTDDRDVWTWTEQGRHRGTFHVYGRDAFSVNMKSDQFPDALVQVDMHLGQVVVRTNDRPNAGQIVITSSDYSRVNYWEKEY